MGSLTDRYQRDENQRWMKAERERRRQAREAVARQKAGVAGMSLIRLPSIADGLDELQPPATRYAGGGA